MWCCHNNHEMNGPDIGKAEHTYSVCQRVGVIWIAKTSSDSCKFCVRISSRCLFAVLMHCLYATVGTF